MSDEETEVKPRCEVTANYCGESLRCEGWAGKCWNRHSAKSVRFGLISWSDEKRPQPHEMFAAGGMGHRHGSHEADGHMAAAAVMADAVNRMEHALSRHTSEQEPYTMGPVTSYYGFRFGAKAPATLSDWIPPSMHCPPPGSIVDVDRRLTGPMIGSSASGKSRATRMQELANAFNPPIYAHTFPSVMDEASTFRRVDSGRYVDRLADAQPSLLSVPEQVTKVMQEVVCPHTRRFPESGACVTCGAPRLTGEPG